MKKVLSLIISVILAVSLIGCGRENVPEPSAASSGEVPESTAVEADVSASAAASAASGTGRNIVIMYTNDVHCGVTGDIGYDGLSQYRRDLTAAGNDVLLVDAGDAVQGGIMGNITKGAAIIDIMNAVGYDLAVPGNHEFDYGMDIFRKNADAAKFDYICCNFVSLSDNSPVLPPYEIKEAGGKKIAFIGALIPSTITSSTPAFFKDEKGNYIYGFEQDESGQKLYETIQKNVDAAHSEGADCCILVSHLGIDSLDTPYMSTDVIKNTTGIDAVIDAHSHSTVESEQVKNKDGKNVLLTQSGTKLSSFGCLTIGSDGAMKAELITGYDKKDSGITKLMEKEASGYADVIAQVIGKSDSDLIIKDPATGTLLVRNNETNLGDFCADAYRTVTNADIAFVNGGGIRTSVSSGNITFGDMLGVNPFGNSLSVISASGQQIADALEYSVSNAPGDFGGFLQVSGITFDVDLSVPSGVKRDSVGMFTSIEGDARRISNIKVNGKPLDPSSQYTLASADYTIRKNGDGYTMFNGDEVIADSMVLDVNALANYLEFSLEGTIPDTYNDPDGDGRIRFIN